MDRLTAMETFVHVVETGSFSAAAKRLGLTIVQTIAQRLGGQVRVENLASGGLRATFEIPG